MAKVTAILVCLAGALAVADAACRGKQEYQLQIMTNWTPRTSPRRTFPSFAHFSPTVYASHNEFYTMWARGGYATSGVENVAQFGVTSRLKSEMRRARGNTFVSDSTSAPPEVGTQRINIMVDGSTGRTRISFISMIAPSTDWFIGISSIDTCSGGSFKDNISGTVFGYDAGTAQDGFQFTDRTSPRTRERPYKQIERLPSSFRAFGSYKLVKL